MTGSMDSDTLTLPSTPRAALAKLRSLPVLFVLVVVLPTLAGAFYFFVLASPVYTSEARFIIRSSDPAQIPNSGLNSVLQGVGLGRNDTDSYAVHDYIMSRSAVAELDRQVKLRALLARPGADFVARFPRPLEAGSLENLYRAYGRYVSVSHDSITGISTLEVHAFAPRDAQVIAESLLNQGETLLNHLNDQAEIDAVTEARIAVDEAQTRIAETQRELTSFRNRERIIDPAKTGVAGLELIGKLSSELATLKAERTGLAAAAPQSPQLPALDDRIRAYQQQIDIERAKMVGENSSLASKIAEYERLSLERDFMSRALTTAVASLETARIDARRKRLHLQRVVNPTAADSALLPHRWRGMIVILLSALLAYATIVLVAAGLREHRQ